MSSADKVERHLDRTYGPATAEHSLVNINRAMDMFGCLEDALSEQLLREIFYHHHTLYCRTLWRYYEEHGLLALWTKLSSANREMLRVWYIEHRALQIKSL